MINTPVKSTCTTTEVLQEVEYRYNVEDPELLRRYIDYTVYIMLMDTLFPDNPGLRFRMLHWTNHQKRISHTTYEMTVKTPDWGTHRVEINTVFSDASEWARLRDECVSSLPRNEFRFKVRQPLIGAFSQCHVDRLINDCTAIAQFVESPVPITNPKFLGLSNVVVNKTSRK